MITWQMLLTEEENGMGGQDDFDNYTIVEPLADSMINFLKEKGLLEECVAFMRNECELDQEAKEESHGYIWDEKNGFVRRILVEDYKGNQGYRSHIPFHDELIV